MFDFATLTQLFDLLDLDLSLFGYSFDPEFAQEVISQYKDLIWLVLTIISTSLVLFGIYVPQRNSSKQRTAEATLSLIDRWNSQQLPAALLEYQHQVSSMSTPLINSEPKAQLYSYFHTVSLLIRERKVDEALIRKSQISAGFLCFYATLLAEQPDIFKKHTYYGREFQVLHRRWKGIAKRLHQFNTFPGTSEPLTAVSSGLLEAASAEGTGETTGKYGKKKSHLYVVPRS